MQQINYVYFYYENIVLQTKQPMLVLQFSATKTVYQTNNSEKDVYSRFYKITDPTNVYLQAI